MPYCATTKRLAPPSLASRNASASFSSALAAARYSAGKSSELRSSLTATSRPRRVQRALKTVPMPPRCAGAAASGVSAVHAMEAAIGAGRSRGKAGPRRVV